MVPCSETWAWRGRACVRRPSALKPYPLATQHTPQPHLQAEFSTASSASPHALFTLGGLFGELSSFPGQAPAGHRKWGLLRLHVIVFVSPPPSPVAGTEPELKKWGLDTHTRECISQRIHEVSENPP